MLIVSNHEPSSADSSRLDILPSVYLPITMLNAVATIKGDIFVQRQWRS